MYHQVSCYFTEPSHYDTTKTINEIEEKFDFAYPENYKKLAGDNMLDFGKYMPNLQIIRQHPQLLFFGGDFELMNFDKILKN